MTVDEVKEFLKKDSMQEAVLIGSKEEREKYYSAIVEVDCDRGKVTYDYDLLAECFAKDFAEDADSEEDAYTQACEWIDYNVVRSLPYWGEHAPLIVSRDPDEDSNE